MQTMQPGEHSSSTLDAPKLIKSCEKQGVSKMASKKKKLNNTKTERLRQAALNTASIMKYFKPKSKLR